MYRNVSISSVADVNETNRPLFVVYAAAALAVALIGARYIKSVGAEQPATQKTGAGWSATDRVGFDTGQGAGAGPGGGQAGPFGVSGNGGATGAAGSGVKFRALVVHVAGAVRRPGIVRVRDGDRVGDAISEAGGPSAKADLNAINLAMRLGDGQQVVVPTRGGTQSSGAGGATGPVSLSSATAEQLDTLDGVGPGLAQKIIAFRAEHGGFRSVDELAEVPGIGDKRLEALRAQLQP
ncbi:MAG: helix-hairpin-helix domain-containing protein [Actinobacteria bacterium]|nr:helix-hairpin-helix domain-containing protein [Actinomycetota bacterium]